MAIKKPTKLEKRLELNLIYRRAKYVFAFIVISLLIISFIVLLINLYIELTPLFK